MPLPNGRLGKSSYFISNNTFFTTKYHLMVSGTGLEAKLPYLPRGIPMKNHYQRVGKRIHLIQRQAGMTHKPNEPKK